MHMFQRIQLWRRRSFSMDTEETTFLFLTFRSLKTENRLHSLSPKKFCYSQSRHT